MSFYKRVAECVAVLSVVLPSEPVIVVHMQGFI